MPYENLAIMLGRPPSVDPGASLARVGAVGRAGYCFHQNGALGTVLGELGFEVSRRHGHVYTAEEDRDDTSLNHLVLVVDGLPTDDNPGGRWWADVGLGDAFRDPLAGGVGHYDQAGSTTRSPRCVTTGGRSGTTAPARSPGSRSRPGPTDQPAVEAAHAPLSAPATGRFAKILVVQRRDATGIDTVRGCLWHRIRADGRTETELATYDAWREALVDGTRLALEDVDDAELRALYADQWAKHEAWTAAGRP